MSRLVMIDIPEVEVRNGITILFYLNRDKTVNLRKRMVVNYTDHRGVEILALMWPVYDEYKRFGMVKDQFDAVKKGLTITKQHG